MSLILSDPGWLRPQRFRGGGGGGGLRFSKAIVSIFTISCMCVYELYQLDFFPKFPILTILQRFEMEKQRNNACCNFSDQYRQSYR